MQPLTIVARGQGRYDSRMEKVELLAPAKDLECGLTAIQCGADAVYMGGPQFGARARAGNRLDDIARLVEAAHLYGVRVYVTLNTLLHDHEIDAAVEQIHRIHGCHADAVIIQDMGLLECDLPPIPLIASTQTHNTTPEQVAFLEQVGFQRVILARELSLEQIRTIRSATTVELEAFVFGALCVGYSGQCLMSYAIGGRSGNRGDCAQPCRKRYRLEDSAGRALTPWRHLLSLRDLNYLDRLDELMDAGIRSFKIEGRLKEQAYVANTVTAFRQRLDSLLERRGWQRSSYGSSQSDFAPDLNKTFNRGFTDTFLDGRRQSPGAIESPQWIGQPLGRVVGVTGDSFQLDRQVTLNNGDGLCFQETDGQWTGTQVNGSDGKVVTPADMKGIEPGRDIYRNLDHAFVRQVTRSRTCRQMAVRLVWQLTEKGVLLTATDEQGMQARIEVQTPGQPARNSEVARRNLETQLAKTGGTAFRCVSVDIRGSQVLFWPLSVINEARREVLARLARVRLEQYPRGVRRGVEQNATYPRTNLSYLGNVLNEKAEAFYRRHGVVQIERAAESGRELQGQVVMTTKYCLRQELGLCLKNLPDASDAGPLILVDEMGHRYGLDFDCVHCEMRVVF